MIAAALMLMLAAQAQPAPKQGSPAAAAIAQTSQVKEALGKAGMSPAGITRLTVERPQLRAALQALQPRVNDLNAKLTQAAKADPVDPDAIGSLIRQRDALSAEFTRIRTDETIATLRDLSPADRKIYLRILFARPRPQGQASPK